MNSRSELARKEKVLILGSVLLIGIFAAAMPFMLRIPAIARSFVVQAGGTVCIRVDGSVDPPSAPIQRDGDIYTFVDNIYDEIVVERSDIVIDGDGYLLKGTLVWWTKGIYLSGVNNVTIRNLEIEDFYTGIYLDNSNRNIIAGNHIAHTNGCIEIRGDFSDACTDNVIYGNTIADAERDGIFLQESSNNTISGNTIGSNEYAGINLGYDTSGNAIVGNDIMNNEYGVFLFYAEDNQLYHNNFVDNTYQSYMLHWMGSVYIGYPNIWDHGYPSGGNYWNDYVDVDLYGGPLQNEIGGDGIWDHPYVMQYDMTDPDNTDNYPLVEPWTLPETIDELKPKIEELWIQGDLDNKGIVRSLLAKLNTAQKLVDKGKVDKAKSILLEDFIPQIQNLSKIHITVDSVYLLIQSAETISANL